MSRGYSGFLDGKSSSSSASSSSSSSSSFTPPIMTEKELQAYAQSATPQLLYRAIELALSSDQIREVLAVAKEVADRGYGKVVQQVEVSRDVRVAWRELGNYRRMPIDLGVLDIEGD